MTTSPPIRAPELHSLFLCLDVSASPFLASSRTRSSGGEGVGWRITAGDGMRGGGGKALPGACVTAVQVRTT